MKIQRHAKILELIQKEDIETQEDLAIKLKTAGFETTQATISRDIKELRLIKIASNAGHYKYSVSIPDDDVKVSAKFRNVLIETVVKINTSSVFCIVKTFPGMAQAAASAIDNMGWQEIIGSIAGDDTIFIATQSEDDGAQFAEKLKRLINL